MFSFPFGKTKHINNNVHYPPGNERYLNDKGGHSPILRVVCVWFSLWEDQTRYQYLPFPAGKGHSPILRVVCVWFSLWEVQTHYQYLPFPAGKGHSPILRVVCVWFSLWEDQTHYQYLPFPCGKWKVLVMCLDFPEGKPDAYYSKDRVCPKDRGFPCGKWKVLVMCLDFPEGTRHILLEG